jgi:branched-chain amino acid transport system substrate-binding protein
LNLGLPGRDGVPRPAPTPTHSLGLRTTQGLVCRETFCWDLNERTRAFAARIRSRIGDSTLCMNHAGAYGAVLHFGPGRIRADGRKLHPAYLFEVKKPEESRGAWDYYNLLQITPAEEAFRPRRRRRLRAVRS